MLPLSCYLLLLLCLAHLSCAMPPEWNLPSMPSSWALNPGGAHRCVRIPKSVELCSDIGYSEMRLPNMLNHDTVNEVVEQTNPWVPLANLACHREIRVLLCSIYAPVCIQQLPDRQIKPCQSLCEAVMQPCAAVMKTFGFTWPEILNCTQFPPDSDLMCIKSSMDPECHACPEKVTYESIIGNYCVNKVVMKARIERVMSEAGGRTQLQLKRRIKFFKSDGLAGPRKRQLRTVSLETNGGCKCRALDAARSDPTKKFLLMGTVSPADGGVTVTHLVEWQQRSRPFKQAMRQIRGGGGKKRGSGGGGGGGGGDAGRSAAAICQVGQLRDPPLLPQPLPTTPVVPSGGSGRRNGGGGGGGGRRGGKNKQRKNGGGGGGGGGRKRARATAPPTAAEARKKRRRTGGGGDGAAEDDRYSYDSFYYSNYQS